MQENDKNTETPEREIDLLELATKLWKQRKTILTWSAIGLLLGLIVAFSIPKEYDASVKLSPETSGQKGGGGGLGALAAMAGLGGAAGGSGQDAVYPQLYPDVVGSIPFLTSLFDVKMHLNESNQTVTLRDYMAHDQRSPWWSKALALPGTILGAFSNKPEETGRRHKTDNFRLTPVEEEIITNLKSRISASVDQKTSVITIGVKMQDPLVAAELADTVVSRLQKYIIDYRTAKARKDLAYAEKLNLEAKQAYYTAQQRYADYQDRNQGLILFSAQTTRDRLENEATLAFNLYNQTAQQLQLAKAKVQEITPVYTTVTPATVPLRASSPKKMMILVGFIFLAVVASSAWILLAQPLLNAKKAITQ